MPAQSGLSALAGLDTGHSARALLIALGVLTGFTGARTPLVWFKICPLLLGASAAMLLTASAV